MQHLYLLWNLKDNCAIDGAVVMASTVISADQSNSVSWKKCVTRNIKSDGANSKEPIHGKTSALQQAIMKFGNRTTGYIINPEVGTEFDNCDEAYEY